MVWCIGDAEHNITKTVFLAVCLPDVSYIQMMDDEFLALMIRRFIFCYYVTRQHKAFKVSLSAIVVIHANAVS